MGTQTFLVAEISRTSLEGNLTSLSEPSDNSVSRNLSQETNQRPTGEYSKNIYNIFNSKNLVTISVSNTNKKPLKTVM